MSGFIYIMSNPSFVDGLIKIGQSDRDPMTYRKAELETTGVPEPFVVEYYAFVQYHHSLEKQVHRNLSHKRNTRNREFFNASVPEAINLIRELGGKKIEFEKVFYKAPEEILAEKSRMEKEKSAELERERLEKSHIASEERRKKEADIKRQKIEKPAREDRIVISTADSAKDAWMSRGMWLSGAGSALILLFPAHREDALAILGFILAGLGFVAMCVSMYGDE